MKINRAFPLEKLFEAIRYYLKKTNRRITFEYILLDGINDRVEEAEQLATLLKDIRRLAYINLIPVQSGQRTSNTGAAQMPF